MSQLGGGCPSENDLLGRALGNVGSDLEHSIDAHVDICSACRVSLAEAMSAPQRNVRLTTLATFDAREAVADRYVIIRRLAVGGMGEVYEARDTWLDELVALKTIAARISDDRTALSRLKSEVRLARLVTHENVCRVYDLGFCSRKAGKIAFLTMELLRGTTLRSHLAEKSPLKPSAGASIVCQMAAALIHAHAAGIIHRDFKSDNVMLVRGGEEEFGRVVVTDFGLARTALIAEAQALTPESHSVLGTLDYMSPEQVQGRPVTSQSDIYSLGVVIYELFAGRLPFLGDSPLSRALARVTQAAPSLREACPGLEPAWCECINRCLQRRPEDRPRSAKEVLDAFQVPRPTPSRSRVLPTAVVSFLLGIGAALVAGIDTEPKIAVTPLPRSPELSALEPAVDRSPLMFAPLPQQSSTSAASPIDESQRLATKPPRTKRAQPTTKPVREVRAQVVELPGRVFDDAIPKAQPPSALPSGDELLNPFGSRGPGVAANAAGADTPRAPAVLPGRTVPALRSSND
jgi:serine/threonine protein kinase